MVFYSEHRWDVSAWEKSVPEADAEKLYTTWEFDVLHVKLKYQQYNLHIQVIYSLALHIIVQ